MFLNEDKAKGEVGKIIMQHKVKNYINRVTEKLHKKKGIILGILAVLTATYPVINIVHNICYQSECEKFYGIPREYFYSTIDNKLLYLGCILILMFICVMPLIIKKYIEKKTQTKAITGYLSFLAISVGLVMSYLNVYNLVEIMNKMHEANDWSRGINNFLDKYAIVTLMVVILSGIFTLFGITFKDNIRNIRWKWIKNIINRIFIFSFVLSILLITYGTAVKLSISVENKTKYELVTIGEEEYVILSKYNDMILVVSYEIGENGQYIFDTSVYRFYEKNQGNRRYINLGYKPEINKGGKNAYE